MRCIRVVALGPCRIELVHGDITAVAVDAIVNAANESLAGGGGVDGAIHRAAGPTLLEECRRIAGGCPTGKAVVTAAGNLSARHVIHTVGPVWQGGAQNEASLLRSCYLEGLHHVRQLELASVAFPAISTGVFGYPRVAAAQIAVASTVEFLREHQQPQRVLHVVFDQETCNAYDAALNSSAIHDTPDGSSNS